MFTHSHIDGAAASVSPQKLALLSNSSGLKETDFGLGLPVLAPGMAASSDSTALAAIHQAQLDAARLSHGAMAVDPTFLRPTATDLMGLERSLAIEAARRQAMFIDMHACSAAGAGFPGGSFSSGLLPRSSADRDIAIARFTAAAQRDFALASKHLQDLEFQKAMEHQILLAAARGRSMSGQMQQVALKAGETKSSAETWKSLGTPDLEAAAEGCLNLNKTNSPPASPVLSSSSMPRMTHLSPPPPGLEDSSANGVVKRKLSESGESLHEEASSGVKKKRAKQVYPDDMPRRPLSAYNFFFSEEREKILEGAEDNGESEKGDGAANEGSSKKDSNDNSTGTPTLSSAAYRMLMRQRLTEKKKRRPHRKTHGKIGFKDLAKTIGQRWRALPTDRVNHYRKLAEMDLQRYRTAMFEYNDKRARQGLPPISTK